jgi:hypothetical protein
LRFNGFRFVRFFALVVACLLSSNDAQKVTKLSDQEPRCASVWRRCRILL